MTTTRVLCTAAAAAALLLTAGPASAAPASAGCVGQFFSEHAGIVPATAGELSVGGFVGPAARGMRAELGSAISSRTTADRTACEPGEEHE